jgi:hypothetical protein
MSGHVSRVPIGRLTLSVAIALTALVLTSFLDARPDRGRDVTATTPVPGPATGPWCGPGDALNAKGCRYATFEQCMAATAFYGTCRPNPAALAITDEGPYRTYRAIYL